MKRIVKFPLLFIAIPAALIAIIVQIVHGSILARGGDPGYRGPPLNGGGMGGGMGGGGGPTTTFGDGSSIPSNVDPFSTIRAGELSADQQTQLTNARTVLTTKLYNWQLSAQTALVSLTLDAFDAELYKQNLLREDIINDAEIAALAILTPEQAEKWETSQLTAFFNTRLGTVVLTEAQKTKIAPLIAEAAKKLAAVKDKESLVKTKGEFWKQVVALLDNAQLTQLFAPTFTGNAASRGRGISTSTAPASRANPGAAAPSTAPAPRPN